MPATIDIAIPDWIELAAVLVSALSGALLAARGNPDHQFDIGGGLVRDVLIGQGAPAALRDERYLITVLIATGLGFFFAGTLAHFQGFLLVLDSAALGLYSVVGADKADQAGLPTLSAILLGTITGVGGGILRDLLSGTTPVIFKRDIYALLATLGSAVYLLLRQTNLSPTAAAFIAIALTFVLRLVVVRYRLDGPRPRNLAVPLPEHWTVIRRVRRRGP